VKEAQSGRIKKQVPARERGRRAAWGIQRKARTGAEEKPSGSEGSASSSEGRIFRLTIDKEKPLWEKWGESEGGPKEAGRSKETGRGKGLTWDSWVKLGGREKRVHTAGAGKLEEAKRKLGRRNWNVD